MRLLLLLFVFTGVQAAAQVSSTSIGMSERDFKDPDRRNWLNTGPRPLRTVIWYPAAAGGNAEPIEDPMVYPSPASAIKDAAVSAGREQYPLILISHGSGGNARHMRWLAYYLTSKGYITAVLNHNGTDEEERKTENLGLTDFCIWERPKDLSVVLDLLLKDPVLGSRIDTSRIGLAGFSLGGATGIWLAGAVFDQQRLAAKEPFAPPAFQAAIKRFTALQKTDPVMQASRLRMNDNYRDARIKAVFALAPAIGQAFSPEGLRSVQVPVQIAVGDADVVTPMAKNAEHYSTYIPTARPLIILAGERGHYTRPVAPDKQAAELLEVSALALQFFDEVLK